MKPPSVRDGAAQPDPAQPGRGSDAALHLSQPARDAIRAEIAAAGGYEVMFYGRLGEGGLVEAVEVASRGHESAAPAILSAAPSDGIPVVALHNHPSGDLRPSEADLGVASALGERGVGFMIVSNDVERVFVVVPPRRPRPTHPVEAGEVQGFFALEGPLAKVLGDDYEPRPGQIRMAEQVAAALSQDQVALLEAGTGTGKTLAYLYPAAQFALRNQTRVVISTATINLQEQVVQKDAPRLRRALPDELRVEVVKGRGNYVSLRRAREAANQESLVFTSEEEAREVRRLASWAEKTRSGDRAELSPPPDPEAWEHLESTADNCLGARCPRYADCHYYESRRRANQAQLLVVNHALLFSDLAIKKQIGFQQAAVLPTFERVVLDEAHHAESIATDHFGVQATRRGLARPLGRLMRKRDRRGILPGLMRRLTGLKAGALARRIEEELLPERQRVLQQLETAFDSIAAHARDLLPHSERDARDAKLKLESARGQRALLEPLDPLVRGLALLSTGLLRLAEQTRNQLGKQAEQVEPLLRNLEAAARRLGRGGQALTALQKDDAGWVRWLELRRDRRGRDELKLRAVPLDVGPLLQEALFEPARSVILSSATLTVAERFDFLEGQLGLDRLPGERVRREIVPSPFDYDRQAILAVPSDLPFPDAAGYEERLYEAIHRAVLCAQGRAFVLFTSYAALNRAHRRMQGPLADDGLLALRQGELSRRELLERFRSSPGAVLFGTDSFWEGVDVPGDQLVLVLIARLPFRVPSEPVQEARAAAVAARGGDPFRELQLPQAVLKLKQGFGRLIRTAQDRGAVAVLDRRLIARSYGRAFFASLPPVRVETPPLEHLAEALAPYVRR